MKRAFIYKDEKSHKFWRIDYSGCCFAVNYSKYGRKERGINAIKRLPLIEGIPWTENEIQSQMIKDLQSFDAISFSLE